jgi:hypothetical protein
MAAFPGNFNLQMSCLYNLSRLLSVLIEEKPAGPSEDITAEADSRRTRRRSRAYAASFQNYAY